mmetsp:Transcript_20763/g.45426  ORF Transcript_20763/g.45426 Transcript_20763/m.45426 type:complete len:149 (-) Transcript_20763:1578-2024(-)
MLKHEGHAVMGLQTGHALCRKCPDQGCASATTCATLQASICESPHVEGNPTCILPSYNKPSTLPALQPLLIKAAGLIDLLYHALHLAGSASSAHQDWLSPTCAHAGTYGTHSSLVRLKCLQACINFATPHSTHHPPKALTAPTAPMSF